MSKKEKYIYLSDTPNIEKDSFQVHSNIADTLFEIITIHKIGNSSFTIGLFGEWGSGKSFIINQLAKRIKLEGNGITFINIDVWKYSGQPLLRSILFELDNQFKLFYKENKNKYISFKDGYRNSNGKSLKDILYYDEIFTSESKLTSEEFYNAIKSLLKRYKIPLIVLFLLFIGFLLLQFIPTDVIQMNGFLKILIPIFNGIATFGAFIGSTAIFISLLQKPIKDFTHLVLFRNTVKNFTEKANFSPEQFEGIFIDMLSKVENEKYVIVFDNLDRCEPHVAYETLSTIKTFMDVKNCFYIIPCDDEAIKMYLSNNTNHNDSSNNFKRKFSYEFIDKIFQTYIRIPYLKEVERDKYIKEQLEKIDFQGKISDSDIDTIKEILYFAYKGESPRNIIRFINDYSTYFRLASKTLPKLLVSWFSGKWTFCPKIKL
ncbi:KAP family P-loop NTPase fold protein [Calditrichota bacterium GD2]